MKREIKVREYRTSDRRKINEMFTKSLTFKRDVSFWCWINKCLSSEEPIIVVADDKGRIVGHQGVIFFEMLIRGVKQKVAFGLHTFIDPDYRNETIIFSIVEKSYELAAERGAKLIYGLPNSNFRAFVKYEGWIKVDLYNSIDFNLKKINLKNTLKYKLEPITASYSDLFKLDEVITNSVINKNIHLIKDLRYFRDRYINHPQDIYKSYVINYKDVYCGFVVYKIYENEEFKKGHLIDYLICKGIDEGKIIDITFDYFKNNVDIVSFWPVNINFKKNLLKHSNAGKGFDTYLGVKYLDNEFREKHENYINNIDNWHFPMGDSDAF